MAVNADDVPVLDARTRDQVEALAVLVRDRDGAPPLSDQALTRLDSPDVVHAVARDGGRLVGYAQRDGDSAEVVAADPAALAPLLDLVERDAPAGLAIWSHGRHSPVAATLTERGYRQMRVLHQLRAPLPSAPAVPAPPAEVRVRPFEVGRDEAAWLTVNSLAFAHHPEQGGWTAADLAAREAESWFEPAGFLVAERADRMIGFHWTKIHEDGRGEVYVLGIDPSAQGLGLGRLLLLAGLAHLYDRGCREVLLYVDDDNRAAVTLYERNGFRRYDRDEQWRHTERVA